MGKKQIQKHNPNFLKEAKILYFDIECFKGETEILTDKGFIRFDRLKDEKVAQYHEDGTIDYIKPIQKIKKDYSGKFRTFSLSKGKITVTENHEMVSRDVGTGVIRKWKANEIPKNGYMIQIDDIANLKKSLFNINDLKVSEDQDTCIVYCVEVPTHMIIVKQGQQILVTGNCSPTLGYTYGQYQTNMIKVERPPVLLSFSWKWANEKEVHCLTLHDRRMPDKTDDSWLVKELWNLLDQANIVVAHNTNFDLKMANAFFLRHNLGLPSFYQPFCTLKTARRFFKLDNNKLDYIGQLLGVGRKTATTHADVWYDCLINDDPKAWKKMATYNNMDVLLLERIYKKLLPFANNHPNVALAAGKPHICPRCGHEGSFKIKAYRRTGTQVNAIQYQCNICKSYVTRKLDKEERLELDFHGKLNTTFRNQV